MEGDVTMKPLDERERLQSTVDTPGDRTGDAGAAGGTARPSSCTAARDEAMRSPDPSCLACNQTDPHTAEGGSRKPRQAHAGSQSLVAQLQAKQAESAELANAPRSAVARENTA